ncbi:MAG: filamentous hemagglutinin N-terminal domain-containing protein, partial [Oleispira sp.]
MERFRKSLSESLITRFVSYSIILQLIFPPFLVSNVYAALVTDPHANVSFQPQINNSSSVPVINIVAPNNTGLSHNKYQDFDIAEEGAVFNNSLVTGNSRLAGQVVANPLFGGRTASIILNEVTGASDSELKGLMEIFGDKANIIIANPNGITCNGCGFINTQRATLTTGTPEFSAEKLKFDVDGGLIRFEGEGHSYRSFINEMDVLSQYIDVNGDISTKNRLSLAAGRFVFDYSKSIAGGTLTEWIEPKNHDAEKSTGRALAIDGTIFGAMQSGQIDVMGTEQGLGVKVDGYLFAQADDLFMQSAGGLSINNADAVREININAADRLVIGADLIANQKISLQGENISTSQETNLISNSLEISATKKAEIHGELKALDIRIEAGETENTADILAVNNLDIVVAGKNQHSDARIAADIGTINSHENEFTDVILSFNELAISSLVSDFKRVNAQLQSTELNLGEFKSSDFILNADTVNLAFSNWQDSRSQFNINQYKAVGQEAIVNESNWVFSNGSVDISGLTLNDSRVYSLESVINSNALNISKSEVLSNDLKINADELNLSSSQLQAQTATLNADNAALNDSTIAAVNLAIKSDAIFNMDVNSVAVVTENVTIDANDLRLKGSIKANYLSINAEQADFEGIWQVSEVVDVDVATVADINNLAVGSNAFSLNAVNGQWDNLLLQAETATLTTTDNLELKNSTIEAATSNITANHFSTDENTWIGANTNQITAIDLTNGGTILSAEQLTLDVTNKVTNVGELASFSAANISASELENSGVITSNELALESAKINNAGTVSATNLDITYQELRNQAEAKLLASEATYTALGNAALFENYGEQVAVNAVQWLQSDSADNSGQFVNTGKLQGNALNFAGLESVSNSLTGVILSNGTVDIGNEEFIQKGRIDSANLNITRTTQGVAGAFSNQGEMFADQLTINSKADLTNSGKIVTETATVDLTKADNATEYNRFTNKNGGVLSAKDLTISGADITNSGQWVATTLDVTGVRSASGTEGTSLVNTETGIIVQRHAINSEDVITEYGSASFSGFDRFTNKGAIEVDELLSIKNVKHFDNNEAKLAEHQINNTLNLAAKISSAGGIVISQTDSITNSGLLIGSAISADSKKVSNTGIIGAGEASIQSSESAFTNNGKVYQSDLELSDAQRARITATTVKGAFNISAANVVNNENGAIEIKNGNITVAEGVVENRGLIRELNDNDDATRLNLLGISSLDNYGSVSITSALVLKDSGALRNHGNDSYLQAGSINGGSTTGVLNEIRNDGTILVRDDISLNSTSFSNNGTARIFAGNIDLTSQNGMTNNGLMQSEGNLSLAANSLQNTGEIIGKGTTTLAVDTLGNSHLIYGDTLNVGSASQIINEIASSSPIRLQAQAANKPTGLVAAENLNLYVNGVMRDVYQATNILLDGTDITIAGTVIGDNKVDVNARNFTVQSGGQVNIGSGANSSGWQVASSFVNNGNIDFNSNLKITAASFENNHNIRGDADLNINTGSFKNNSGAVISIKDTTPTNADINNIQISGILDGFSATDKASTFSNLGEIHSDGALDIAANDITVNGNIKALDDSEWHFDNFTNNNRITVDGTWTLGNSSARSGNVVNNGRLYGERIEAYTSGTFSNNQNAKIVAYDSDVILNVSGSLNNASGAVIYGKNRFDLNASSTINNVGVIESFTAGHTSNISSLVFNNGSNEDKAGIIRTAGSLSMSVDEFTNHSYEGANKGSSKSVEKAIDYRYDPSTGGSDYYWRHYVTFVDGVVNDNVYSSGVYVGQNLNVNDSNVINNGGEMSVVGNFNLTKSTFKNKNSKVSDVNTNVLSWYRKTSDNKSATNSYGNSFENRFAAGGEQKEAAARELEETIYYDNGLYYWKGPWHVDETNLVATQGARGGDPINGIQSLAAVSVDNPYGLGLVYVGGALSTDHSDIENSGALNAGSISTRDSDDSSSAKNIADKDAANAVDTADANDQSKGSFSNQAEVNVLNLVAAQPTPTISLLAFIIPGLSFEALNAASVAGDKTPEELAAQAALQAQLNLLNGDKDQNSKSLQSQSDGHGTQAPSLFDLDADILARIIADTEYELSPEYIFDKVDPDKTLNTEPKFFLDPYQEAQAVTQAALQQTGTAFFSPDWTTSADQRKGLYDNTLEYLVKQQGVTLGKALTPMQVKQLEQPMIWYVSMNIGGQSQLVPTVYLPEATLDQITTPSAGTIIADSIDLDVSEFKNTGDIKVANSARIRADVITNQRNVMKFGDETNYTAIAGAGGNISAGDLTLISRSDINNNGGSLSARTGLTLDAKGDINLNALELNRRSQSGQNITESTDYLLSQINAGGDATFKAGGDINSQAAQAKIGGNGIFDATNINLLGVTERDYSKTVSKKKSLTSSSKTTIEQEKLDFIGSDFQIGGNMLMNAKNDITMVGANVDIGKSAAIKAGNDITLTAGISTDKYSKQKSGSGVATTSSQQKGHVKETATGTMIKTGESLQIDSDGGNVTILASELDAQKSLVLGDMKVKVDESGNKMVDENGQYIAEDGSSINNLT